MSKYEKAIKGYEDWKDYVKPGLQTLKKDESKRFKCSKPYSYSLSVKLDDYYKEIKKEDNDNRWDYIVLYNKEGKTIQEYLIYIEIHYWGSEGKKDIDKVLLKLQWLKERINLELNFINNQKEDYPKYFWFLTPKGKVVPKTLDKYKARLKKEQLHVITSPEFDYPKYLEKK
ncbi:MAG: hypothetical protein H7A25_17175 [Leptospiraceae bacterium]|nr:hypothetical protein [Leptospiraceae bacterium]